MTPIHHASILAVLEPGGTTLRMKIGHPGIPLVSHPWAIPASWRAHARAATPQAYFRHNSPADIVHALMILSPLLPQSDWTSLCFLLRLIGEQKGITYLCLVTLINVLLRWNGLSVD